MERSSRKRKRNRNAPPVRIPAAEQLLIDAIPEITAETILCTTLGRGQFAVAAAEARPAAHVVCHFLDCFPAEQTRLACQGRGGNLEVACAADFPAAEVDLVAIPVDTRGEAELTRDFLQAGRLILKPGGRLLASIQKPDDQWLHQEMRKLFPKVTRRPTDRGVLYLANNTAPLKRVKPFDCEFAFRDEGRLIRAVSRPGVFSHRSLDAGARALLNAMVVKPHARVLDIGCGSGGVGLAAAFRAEGVQVVALDSNARALDCTRRGAELNSLQNISTWLSAEGQCGATAGFDLALGNPPYFSDYRIAEVFLQAALAGLKPGGRVLMVTKTPLWFEQRMGEMFDDVVQHAHKAYFVIEGVQRARPIPAMLPNRPRSRRA